MGVLNEKGMRDVGRRENLLDEEITEGGKARAAAFAAMLNSFDNETIAPSAGLRISTERVVSDPDGNLINIPFIRPDNSARVPCVYYIHGGGMPFLTCYYGNCRSLGRMIPA